MTLVDQIKQSLTPRAAIGLALLALIGLFVIIDWGGRSTTDLELSNIALKQKVTALRALETEDNLERLTSQADDLWRAYETLLLQDETEGLNIAELQSTIITTLTDCGLESVVANIDTGPVEADPAWKAYTVTVRAQDRDKRFPLCFGELSQLDVGIIVSDITWRRPSNLQLVLNAYSAAQADTVGGSIP